MKVWDETGVLRRELLTLIWLNRQTKLKAGQEKGKFAVELEQGDESLE